MIAASVIGAGISVYGNIQQGKAAKQAADYNAQVQENQAESLRMQRSADLERTMKMRSQMREQKRRKLSGVKTGFAGAGVLTTGGSPLDSLIDADTQLTLSMTNETERRIGRTDAMARQATLLSSKANMTRWEGANAKSQSKLAAAGAGVKGVGNAAGSYMSFKQGQ